MENKENPKGLEPSTPPEPYEDAMLKRQLGSSARAWGALVLLTWAGAGAALLFTELRPLVGVKTVSICGCAGTCVVLALVLLTHVEVGDLWGWIGGIDRWVKWKSAQTPPAPPPDTTQESLKAMRRVGWNLAWLGLFLVSLVGDLVIVGVQPWVPSLWRIGIFACAGVVGLSIFQLVVNVSVLRYYVYTRVKKGDPQ